MSIFPNVVQSYCGADPTCLSAFSSGGANVQAAQTVVEGDYGTNFAHYWDTEQRGGREAVLKALAERHKAVLAGVYDKSHAAASPAPIAAPAPEGAKAPEAAPAADVGGEAKGSGDTGGSGSVKLTPPSGGRLEVTGEEGGGETEESTGAKKPGKKKGEKKVTEEESGDGDYDGIWWVEIGLGFGGRIEFEDDRMSTRRNGSINTSTIGLWEYPSLRIATGLQSFKFGKHIVGGGLFGELVRYWGSADKGGVTRENSMTGVKVGPTVHALGHVGGGVYLGGGLDVFFFRPFNVDYDLGAPTAFTNNNYNMRGVDIQRSWGVQGGPRLLWDVGDQGDVLLSTGVDVGYINFTDPTTLGRTSFTVSGGGVFGGGRVAVRF